MKIFIVIFQLLLIGATLWLGWMLAFGAIYPLTFLQCIGITLVARIVRILITE